MELQIKIDGAVLDRRGIQEMAGELSRRIQEGEIDPLLPLMQFKVLDEIRDQIKETMRDSAVREMGKYGKEGVVMNGIRMEPMEAGTQYDYSGCNDPEYERLLWESENAKKALAAKQKQLREMKGPVDLLDHDTGEVITINPPVKTSTSTVKCTIL